MKALRTLLLDLTLFTAALNALGCDAAASKPDDCPPAGASSNAGSGGEAPGQTAVPPARVECTFFFRQSNELLEGDDPADPKFEFEERLVSVAKNEDASETLGKLTLDVRYDDSEHEGSSVGVGVSSADHPLFRALYQLGERGLVNQFSGDQGFTGLIYLTHPTDGGDYQLICKARATAR